MLFESIKKDFPLLSKKNADGSALIYLDSGATAQKPQIVIDAIVEFYQNYNSNIRRGLYPIGEHATQCYEDVRKKTAQFINAAYQEEIIFTKGTTEGINFIAQSWALQHLKQGDEILLTQAEHHANLLPWQRIAQQVGAKLVFIPVNKTTFMLDDPVSFISQKTKLVAVTHSSNVLGDIWGSCLETFIEKAQQVGAKVLLDGAQSIAHQLVDVQALGVDFFVFSGHKIFAPTGVGVLYVKKSVQEEVVPYQLGGSMVYSVAFESAEWSSFPERFEAGTPGVSSVLGLGAAIDYIQKKINFEFLQKYEAQLCSLLLDGFKQYNNIYVAGNQDIIRQHGHLVSFAVDDVHPHDLADYLGRCNIAVRAGHHCAQPLVNMLGKDALLRVSVTAYNTPEDISHFLKKFNEAITFFNTLI